MGLLARESTESSSAPHGHAAVRRSGRRERAARGLDRERPAAGVDDHAGAVEARGRRLPPHVADRAVDLRELRIGEQVAELPRAGHGAARELARRPHPDRRRVDRDLRLGASPRATLQLVRAAKARAALDGRDFVLPDDIDALAVPVLAHRLVPTRAALGSSPLGAEALAEITARIVASTPVPLGAAGPA